MPDGLLSDVGTKNEELWEQALADSKANGDHVYPDNPYQVGGAMENICPWTGKYQVGWDGTNGFGGFGRGRGNRGFNRGRGGGTGERPKIGPGSFDKATMGASKVACIPGRFAL